MTTSGQARLISADDHIDLHTLPADLWQTRLPKALRDRAPRVVETEKGPWWEIEGRLLMPHGRKESELIAAEGFGFRPSRPEERIRDLDADGVHTHVIFAPSTTALQIRDAALRNACLSAYNDWAAEFNRYDPDRLIALPDIGAGDPEAAAKELERCIAAGHRSASLSGASGAIAKGIEPVYGPSWLRFWDIASEAKLPINVHLGGGLHTIEPAAGSWTYAAMAAVIPMQLDEILAGMIFSGILEERPDVSFIMAETGLGWIPYVIERMDEELDKYGDRMHDHRIAMKPSEIFRRQVLVTYQDEAFGVECIPRIGIENVMWASDYPHGDTTWPHSREKIAASPLASLGEEALRKVTCENAARIYGIE
jgi:predicted TIM-barrel fold metal-dependent hydrolase